MTAGTSSAYLALWAATALGIALTGAGLRLATMSAPHDALPAQAGTVLELVAHNAPVALWPLALVALDWPAIPLARHGGDALIGSQLLAHGLLAGTALGQHPDTWRYVPHLPLEWLAIALAAGAWITARRHRRPSHIRLVVTAASVVATLAVAAAVETYLVPVP